MKESLGIHEALGLDPAGIASICIFLVGFHASIGIWLIRTTGNTNLRSLLLFFSHNRKMLFKSFFTDGPGYLVLPLWLILAVWADDYLLPVLAAWMQ